MKDNIFLLISALVIAALSWFLWHLMGQNASSVLLMATVLFLLADNTRLRRILKSKSYAEEKTN